MINATHRASLLTLRISSSATSNGELKRPQGWGDRELLEQTLRGEFVLMLVDMVLLWKCLRCMIL